MNILKEKSLTLIPSKAGTNFVIVEVDLNENRLITFESGVKLIIDPEWNPQYHAPRKGKVIGQPGKLYYNKKDPHNSMKWKTTCEVKEGETVYFDYTASVIALGRLANPVLRDAEAEVSERYFTRGKRIFLVLYYSDLYATKRADGTIVPLNGHIIVEPILTTPETTLIVPDQLKKQKSHNTAVVLVTGSHNTQYTSPKFTDAVEIEAGDIIVFKLNAMLQLEYSLHASQFASNNAHVIQRKYIMGVVDK